MKKYLAILLAAVAVLAALAVGLLQTGKTENGGEARVFTFRDGGVSFSGGSTNYTIDGTHVSITGSGVFTLTGACSDGSVTVKKDVTDVTLILRDLELCAEQTAPIVLKSNSEAELRIEGACALTDAENPENEGDDSFEGAAIKVKTGAALSLTGSGSLTVTGSAKNAIKGAAESSLVIDGPTVSVTAEKDGVACDGEITLLGGSLEIDAKNDGIKSSPDDGDTVSAGAVTLLGGKLRIAAGDDAIHAAGVLTIGTQGAEDGPQITVTQSREGMEGATVLLYSGSGAIQAEDDAVNAGGGGENRILVAGGSWLVDSDGDGMDANGEILVTGGKLEVYGASNGSGGNTAMDSDTGVTVTGGTLFSVDTDGTQPAGVRVRFTGLSLQEGSELEIHNADGSVIAAGTARKSANTVLLAGDALSEGENYTLYVDGTESAAATAENGEYTGGMFGGMRGGGPNGEGRGMEGDRPQWTGNRQAPGPGGGQIEKDRRLPEGMQPPTERT